MKRHLLPPTGKFYKANLHCHTTVSDGNWTPEKVKEVYLSQGYSIIAFTDHDVLRGHPELKDDSFLPLNGLEIEMQAPQSFWNHKRRPWVHFCLIAKEEENLVTPFYHRTRYIKYHEKENRSKILVDESLPDYERFWDVESINRTIAIAKEKGFFVICNHPAWSMEDPARLMQYQGLDAMEIWNSSSVVSGYPDDTPILYDAVCRYGNFLYPIAADDNHNRVELDHKKNVSCLGWIQIKAEKLEYRTVTRALEKGNFYASTGPEIYDLWMEDGSLFVATSPAKAIFAVHAGGRTLPCYGEDDPVTGASFSIDPDRGPVRVTVKDDKGFAVTRFYDVRQWV